MTDGPIKFLIVEDEYLIAQDTQWMLTDLGFESIGIAMDGPSALERLMGARPDVVLLDVILPGDLNGMELASILVRDHRLPVVFLTGNVEALQERLPDDLRHLPCVPKPSNEHVLVSAIYKVLR